MSEHFIPLEKVRELYDIGLHPIPLRWSLKKKQPEYHPSHGKKDTTKLSWQMIESAYHSVSPYVNGIALKLFSPFGMFDFDLKNTTDKTVYDEWLKLIKDRYPEVLDKVSVEKTRSGGYHVYIRFSDIGNSKIALAKTAEGSEIISIYTGGLLSYCAPTPGYEQVFGQLNALRALTAEEYNFMQEAATMFHVKAKKVQEKPEEDNPFAGLRKKPDEQFIKVIQRIVSSGIDITGGYDQWRNIGFALINAFGEDAREPFREISQIGNYDPQRFDQDFDGFLASDYRKGSEGQKITIGSFYKIAKDTFPDLEIQLYQYCGMWVNNFKAGNCELSVGKFVDALVNAGYYSMAGEYVHFKDGLLSKISKEALYYKAVEIASARPAIFTVPPDARKKDGKPVTFIVEKYQLSTFTQKFIAGKMSKISLPEFDRVITRDSMTEVYFHFANKSVKVTKEGAQDIDRGQLCIWANQVIKNDLLEDEGLEYSQFELFVKNIAGDKLKYFKAALGYAMRDSNGADGLKALWLYDDNYEVGRLNGRTGKSLFVKALGKMRKTDINSGKDYDPKDKFKFQNMDHDTQICVLDDAKENLSFESLFNYCTEGAEFQHKYADRVKLSPEQTPKLIVTSNFPPPVEQGGSVTGRLIILPVGDFYTKFIDEGGVKHIHKQTFFTDWNAGEWSLFFHFMIDCSYQYLREGIEEQKTGNAVEGRLKSVFYKRLQDQDMSDSLAAWLIGLDRQKFKKFDPDELIKEWGFTTFDIDSSKFRECLRDFFSAMKWTPSKSRTRSGGGQKFIWNVQF